ncbi:VWA domain-containing protein [Terriglobus saanensis]|uniref:VWFA-related domain-containing protein n=1 Tax=Terriglobus saanensis (strain ATCC BAA-1853 / DSM 23119 / SP1PR4) TaxID=401053 RepID=E8V1M6_TERSS|nr:VWA domain-containing protein [Terriglobus saanensis]ADV82307.1 VWFA-related domain-containing protein [Terriglobus saanensis SP1PR4]
MTMVWKSKSVGAAALALSFLVYSPGATAQQQKPAEPDASDSGPVQDNSPVIVKKKTDTDEPPPPAPAEEKIKNPTGLENYSIRVDVPVVTVDVSVVLEKTRQFVPGLKTGNFRVYEDGVEQKVGDVRTVQTPITAVMLLEFAANSWYFLQDMRNTSDVFFRTLKPEDYIAIVTYDLRTHILTDFTQDKRVTAEALNSLTIPGFSDTNMFDALSETLDRLTRIDGRKYIILVGTGRDTFSKLTLDKILAKVKQAQNVTIFAIGTGQLVRELADSRGRMGGIARMDYLQADNQMKTFAQMTGGQAYFPLFQGALPDVFSQINQSIRNQYVVSYRPSNIKQDGTYRKIKVELVDNEGKPLRMVDEKQKNLKYAVIARDGYKSRLPVE